MDAPVLYMVRVWVSPNGGERYLRWLENKHMAEVISEPGFLWARKCRLEQTDEQGWAGYLLIYGLESRESLETYLHSPARDRFWQELEPFNDVHKAERFYGSVDFQMEAKTNTGPVRALKGRKLSRLESVKEEPAIAPIRISSGIRKLGKIVD